MQCNSHSECCRTAACVSEPLRVINIVHQKKDYSRDAAGEGDVSFHRPIDSDVKELESSPPIAMYQF